MDTPHVTDDFKEFLRLLSANRVDYLLVGGYPVGFHGYRRATVDLDIRVSPSVQNATRSSTHCGRLGFDAPSLENTGWCKASQAVTSSYENSGMPARSEACSTVMAAIRP
jgi:hypothetical protein